MSGEFNFIKGGLSVDDRGQLAFVNDFNFEKVKRFYSIQNHKKGFVRAWHGHKKEAKYFYCAKGTFLIGAVKIDNWESPANKNVNRTVLSEKNPGVLYIPEGFANGLMSLSDDAILMVFSTTALQESLNDDFRFSARQWDIWQVEER